MQAAKRLQAAASRDRQRKETDVPTDVRIDQEWKALADLEEEARIGQMTERFRSLISASEEDRLARLEAMIHAEYELPDDVLREFTHSRLRVWVELAADDPEGARSLGRGYDHVFETLPAEMAMRRASMVQSIGSNRMTPEDLELLFDVIPGLARQLPRRPHAALTAKEQAEQEPEKRSRPFWSRFLFGRRSTATS
jgi:hypothetical protein